MRCHIPIDELRGCSARRAAAAPSTEEAAV